MHQKLMFLFVWAIFFLTVPALAAFDSAKSDSSKPLEITRITPSGVDVPPPRQIVIQFNQPVIPVGKMGQDLEQIPVEITPSCNCQWQWLNTSALACQLAQNDAMAAATKYQITIHPGIATQTGETIHKTFRHQFITQRPDVRYTWFKTWKSPGMPMISVSFNQAVFKDSVSRHIYMIQGKERYAVNVEPDPDDQNPPMEKNARTLWLVSPKKELPLDADVQLEIEPGLIGASGKEPGVTQRTLVTFNTFPEFKFIGVRGRTNDGETLIIRSKGNASPDRRFDPLNRISLVFSAPVLVEDIKNTVKFTPDLAGGRTDYDPWANTRGYSQLNRAHKKGDDYEISLPEVLQAWKKYHVTSTSPSLKDEFGRKLLQNIDAFFYTDHRKPDFHLTHKTAVLEKAVDTKMPLVITNIDKIMLNTTSLTATMRTENQKTVITPPVAQDTAFPVPMGIRNILNGKSGAVYGQISTQPPVKKSKWENTFFAQITPFNVHVKIGHFNTLVWVTDLSTGKPVPNAKISIYKDTLARLSGTYDVQATTGNQGIVMLPGTALLDPELSALNGAYDDNSDHLFVKVQKEDDLTLIPLEYRFQIDTWQVAQNSVSAYMKPKHGHINAWGTTAQGVYRAGDTIQYKLYVRDQNNTTFTAPPLKGYALDIIDPMGKSIHTIKDLTLSEFGAYDAEFTVPKNGASGWYSFKLSSDYTQFTWFPIQVLVTDFTPSPFRVENQLNGDLFHQNDEVHISTFARLHAGGPYTEAGMRITARLSSRYFSSDHPVAKGFSFDTDNSNGKSVHTIYQGEFVLDNEGKQIQTFIMPDKDILYGQLSVESAVRDDRGKYIAASSSADYMGRDRFVGLKHTQWIYNEDQIAQIESLVVDEHKLPIQGTDIDFTVEHLVTRAARVKGAGNAYLTQYIDEWVKVHEQSKRSTDTPVICEFTPETPGSYRVTATIKDTQGRSHSTRVRMWVAGKGRVIWQQPDDNRLEIIPEQDTYKIGDTARYLVKNPFSGATALISIERYGVIKHWTQILETSTPVIEFEVEPDFLPGFYLSVVVTSPRVSDIPDDGDVDLGKPVFRMGYVSVPVKDPYKEIQVKIKPDKTVYKPGETVTVSIQAQTSTPQDTPEPIELAVAVVDEAVFDLLKDGRDAYDPYKGFYTLDGLDLYNYNLLTRLVGLQRLALKGASPGGGGGSNISMRSVFKFVSYWNPSIKTDANGNAGFQFDVPDNLTGWRIFAMAVTPTDKMGLGDQNFKVNRPTEIRPVMPNQVTRGDMFNAGFSIMNRTDSSRTLTVSLNASGPVDTVKTFPQHTRMIILDPYKRTTVWMPVQTNGSGSLTFKATAHDALDGDGVEYVLPVKEQRSLETEATYGTTTQDLVSESIQFPENIYTDTGDLSIVLSPSVIGNVQGAFAYLRDYPYSCWEQKLTRGVMASHYLNLKPYLPESFVWKDVKDLPQKTLDTASDFQAPNGGMTYFRPSNTYSDPYLSAYTALAFSWLKNSGYQIPEQVETKLHGYLSALLKKDVLPTFYSRGMSSTVRAVALAALAEQGQMGLSDLERYQPHVPYMNLFGKAHYLQAALKLNGAQSIIKDVTRQILAHSSQTGGKFLFNETSDTDYKRILATPLRANAAILSAFTRLGETDYGKDIVGDIPFKMVRAMSQARQSRPHWDNTQENIFCLNALVDYSRIYETLKPDMTVKTFLDNRLMGQAKFKDLKNDPVHFIRPFTAADPGKNAQVSIQKKGAGRLYYETRLSFAPMDARANRINAGIDIRKEYSVERDGNWILLTDPMQIKRGELVRVDIFLSLPAARHFVVVDDPVPGGLEPVNAQLATASVLDAQKADFNPAKTSWWFKFSDWLSYGISRWSFYHQELGHDAVRFYSDYLGPGNYHLSYTAQAIASGRFLEMPVHAREMYEPDVFGKGLPAQLHISDEN